MKKRILIEGFWDRVDSVCYKSGLSKTEIARRIGCDRKTLMRMNSAMMNSGYLAKFCAITGTSADYLLGLREGSES